MLGTILGILYMLRYLTDILGHLHKMSVVPFEMDPTESCRLAMLPLPKITAGPALEVAHWLKSSFEYSPNG